MPLFDQTIAVNAARQQAWAAAEVFAGHNKQVIRRLPQELVVAVDECLGFVLLVGQREAAGPVYVRLVVDRADVVTRAFRDSKGLGESRAGLTSAPQTALVEPGRKQLAHLKREAEHSAADSGFEQPLPASPPAAPAASLAVSAGQPGPSEPLTFGPPWDPLRLWAYGMWVPIFGSVVLSINWRRLGKKSWLLPSLLLSVGLQIGSMVGLITLAPNLRSAPAMTQVAIGFGIMLYFGTPTTLAVVQWFAHRKWKQTDSRQALLDHDYNFVEAALLSCLVVGAILVVVLILMR